MQLLTTVCLVSLFTAVSYSGVDYEDPDLIQYMKRNSKHTQERICQTIESLRQRERCFSEVVSGSYGKITDFIREHDLKVGCEVGVAFGGQSLHILRGANVERLYSIEPYPGRENVKYLRYLLVRRRLDFFGQRSVFIRDRSPEASRRFADESLDFVYLDGEHTYRMVSKELPAWWPKLRRGGYLLADDYGHKKYPGVVRAVDEFARKKDLKVTNLGHSCEEHKEWGCKVAIQKPL